MISLLVSLALAQVQPMEVFPSVLIDEDHEHEWRILEAYEGGAFAIDTGWEGEATLSDQDYPTALLRTRLVSDTNETFFMDALFAVNCETSQMAMTDAWMGTPGTDQQVRAPVDAPEFVPDSGIGPEATAIVVQNTCFSAEDL